MWASVVAVCTMVFNARVAGWLAEGRMVTPMHHAHVNVSRSPDLIGILYLAVPPVHRMARRT